jgi:dipeptidyl aminopeptidase/acylaminoacyl peptidase
LREGYDAIRHWTRATYLNVDQPAVGVAWSGIAARRLCKHPGNVVLRALPSGFWVLDMEGEEVYMNGLGASTDGDRPFLDRLNLATGKSVRLFRSEKTAFEVFVCLLPGEELAFVTRRESPTEPPNYFRRMIPRQLLLTGRVGVPEPTGEAAFDSTIAPLTHQTDPAPAVRGIQKRLVKYKRADGVDLSFTLYLPPGYKEGTRLPTVVWAYPLDYADAKMAGQVVGSTQRFTILGWPLQLFFLLDGYAVIDNPSLPVVGDTTKIYDTYMEQLIAGAGLR